MTLAGATLSALSLSPRYYYCKDSLSTSTILSPISVVFVDPPRSAVRNSKPPMSLLSSTLRTAVSMAAAYLSRPSEYRRSIAALRIVPIGFAMPLPAMSGAEPWIGS